MKPEEMAEMIANDAGIPKDKALICISSALEFFDNLTENELTELFEYLEATKNE